MKSFRRECLDQFLTTSLADARGVVIDIGGEKFNYRGNFRPPFEQVSEWTTVNIDPNSGADILSSVYNIPLPDAHADIILMTELLEHLREPEAALVEVARLIKPGGRLIATMPFMYQVHGDPDDYYRWTADAMRQKVEEAGLCVTALDPMGGTWSVIYDALRSQLYHNSDIRSLRFRLYYGVLKFMKPLFKRLDLCCKSTNQQITTGWALQAKK